MTYFLTGILLFFSFISVHAQHSFRAVIANPEKEPLPGASILWKESRKTFVADSTGLIVISHIPPGRQTFVVSFAGYQPSTLQYDFPLSQADLTIQLEEQEAEEEIILSVTRTSRTIYNTPTRIEVISGEELEEKGNMKPGEIRMLLGESTGIQTQQTSATSYNQGIRIQGLDGRYTQILKDGYPLYSGFAGGLSIMQIAPLDLKQVEVIKGSASTLYGGGAIAGLVNLVSKTPGEERRLDFIANATSAGGLDLSGFYSQRYGKAGLTLFASRNSSRPYDPADIGLTAIPKFERYSFHPRVFLYGKKTTADVGITYITEERTGGSLEFIRHGGPGFFEKNNTRRLTTQLGLARRLGERTMLRFKNSYTRFNRSISIPAYEFAAVQQASFSELTWSKSNEMTQWVIGTNLLTDDLSEDPGTTTILRNYHLNTLGVFVQNVWTASGTFTLESGLRADYVSEFGVELLPRLSALFRLRPDLTTRIGGGFGYKNPTVFNEEAERIQFQGLFPIDVSRTQNERSVGGNWDINYNTHIGSIGVSINHLFFYTRLNRPLVLVGAPGGKVEFLNANGHLDTRGMETNLRLLLNDFKLFLGYTYTDANTHFANGKAWLPLTARHRLNNVLMYEIEEKLKLGLEAYYFSPQKLNDGQRGRPYWIAGFMAEKIWKRFSVFINFENFTNTRQTRFDTIYSGTIENPVFRDIYAPVEGFVVNGGIKIRV